MLQLFQKITALLKIYMEKCVYRTWMPSPPSPSLSGKVNREMTPEWNFFSCV
jgi:hypothetical protein